MRGDSLVLGHDLRLEAAVSVAGNLDGQFAKLALERFAALAVSGVAQSKLISKEIV